MGAGGSHHNRVRHRRDGGALTMRILLLAMLVLAPSTAGRSELTYHPPDMRAVIWVDEDSKSCGLNFKTMRIEPCGEECSQNLANNWKGCW